MVVLEALRIFDEKNRQKLVARDGEPAESEGGEAEGRVTPDAEVEALWEEKAAADGESAPPVDPDLEEAEIDDTLKILLRETEEETSDLSWSFDLSEADGGAPAAPARVQVVTDDMELIDELSGALPGSFARPARLGMRDAGLTLPGELTPVVVIDLRAASVDLERLAALTRARKRAAVIVLVSDPSQVAPAYEAGALAALPPVAGAVAACVQSVIRNRITGATPGVPSGSALAKLKRVVADLRSGLLSATVALNLMNVISESVERAIMFLVRGEELVAVGAFGFSGQGEPLATAARGLRLRLRPESKLAEAVSRGEALSTRFDELGLSDELAELLGAPRTRQVVVFPVLGSERVIALIYSDNGALGREIEEIEIIELATAQVGVAFENEILRRKMAYRAESGETEELRRTQWPWIDIHSFWSSRASVTSWRASPPGCPRRVCSSKRVRPATSRHRPWGRSWTSRPGSVTGSACSRAGGRSPGRALSAARQPASRFASGSSMNPAGSCWPRW